MALTNAPVITSLSFRTPPDAGLLAFVSDCFVLIEMEPRGAWEAFEVRTTAVYNFVLHQPCVLKLPAKIIGSGELGQIPGQPEDLHDGQIGAYRDACPASFQRAQGHGRHPGALGNLFGRELATQTRKLEPLAEFDEQLVGRRQERSGLLGHGDNISSLFIDNSQNIITFPE